MNFRKLNIDVLKGKSGGKILWQPRIGCWKTDKERAGIPLPPPYDGMDLWEIYDELGCSPRPYWPFNECFRKSLTPEITVEEIAISNDEKCIITHTPVGELKTIWKKGSAGFYTTKHGVETTEDIAVQEFIIRNTQWSFDMRLFNELDKKLGDRAAPCMYVPRIPIQRCFIEFMGVENAIYALNDYPKETESLFSVIEENNEKLIKVICECPVEIINFGDNVHAGTLPPKLFEKYAIPVYKKRTEILKKAGKFTYAHWDGDTKPILRYAHETGLDGIEAITPVPQGDVTLKEIKEGLGDDLFLFDGIPAIYFDETFPVSALEDCTWKLLEMFAPKLILGISDEISSTGDIERIKIVGAIVEKFNNSQTKPDC